MKYIFFFIVGQFTLLNIVFSQNVPGTVLWEIKNRKHATSYLLGTMHNLNGAVFLERFPIILDKIKQSDFFISEISHRSGQEDLNLDKLFYSGDTTNKKILPEDDYNTIMTYFKSKDNDSAYLSKLEKAKPALLHLAFLEANADSSDGLNNQKSLVQLDDYLEEVANNNGKKIIGLETGDERSLALLRTISDKKMLAQVLVEIKAKKNNETSPIKKADPYLELLKTNYFLNKWGNDFGGVKERNALWVPQIIDLTNTEKCFIAVGVHHLIGKYGLITTLRKKGYTLTPIKMN